MAVHRRRPSATQRCAARRAHRPTGVADRRAHHDGHTVGSPARLVRHPPRAGDAVVGAERHRRARSPAPTTTHAPGGSSTSPGVLERALPEVAADRWHAGAPTSAILDPMAALRFPVVDRLDSLATQLSVPSGTALVVAALVADVCDDAATAEDAYADQPRPSAGTRGRGRETSLPSSVMLQTCPAGTRERLHQPHRDPSSRHPSGKCRPRPRRTCAGRRHRRAAGRQREASTSGCASSPKRWNTRRSPAARRTTSPAVCPVGRRAPPHRRGADRAPTVRDQQLPAGARARGAGQAGAVG